MKYRNHMKSIADVLKEFQDARMIVTEEHEKKILELQEYVGSKFYGKAVKAEETAFAEKLESMIQNAVSELRPIYEEMRENIDNRTISPPTEEQLRLLQAATLKESLSSDELERLAKSVSDNAFCVGIVAGLARKNQVAPGHILKMGRELSNEAAVEMMDGMTRDITDFLRYDTSRAARVSQGYYARNYGSQIPSEGLAKRARFHNTDECFLSVCGWDTDTQALFQKAVDV